MNFNHVSIFQHLMDEFSRMEQRVHLNRSNMCARIIIAHLILCVMFSGKIHLVMHINSHSVSVDDTVTENQVIGRVT